MRLKIDILGDLPRLMAEEITAAEKAVTAAVRAAGDGLKTDLRAQVVTAGLGPRLARTWRGEVYPKGRDSITSAALVWSKAPHLIGLYDQGAVIRSRQGFHLAIPTEAAGKYGDGGRKITPLAWERRTGLRLRFVYRRNGPSLLVADSMRARTGKRGGFAVAGASARRTGRGLVSVPMFILVPRVTVRKRLDVAAVAARWEGRLAGLVAGRWKSGGE